MQTAQCLNCKWYLLDLKCTAFTKRIPLDILHGKFDHTKKHPKQKNNILFEPAK